MKYILILLLYTSPNGQIVGVTSAEFDDQAACYAAYTVATKAVQQHTGDKNSVHAECVPKASTAPAMKK